MLSLSACHGKGTDLMSQCHLFLFIFYFLFLLLFFFFFCNNVSISSFPCLLSLFWWAYSKVHESSQPWFGGDVLLQASAGNRRGAVPACSSRGCSLADKTCLFRERARQFTPSWKTIKEMKIDVGRMRSRLLWCCKVAEEVEALCWA